MNNNDLLIRLRYALDIKDTDMIQIFQLGGMTVTKEELQRILQKPENDGKNESKEERFTQTSDRKKCSNHMLESFLNGFIILNRGKQESKPGQEEKPSYLINDNKTVNNIFLKKVKIALSLTSEDMLDIFGAAGVILSSSELSALFRREGQRNYKECKDGYIKNFLKGLTLKYRKN